jgi:GDPmannose 4,6-dehydratase
VIFGVSGQDGHYLTQFCVARGLTVIGCARSDGPWVRADVSDYEQVLNVLKDARPQYIFHLAANSTTAHPAVFENHGSIATGSLNILESARRYAPDACIFLTGSGVQFRNVGAPISERDPFDATSPYAVARIHSVYAGRYYRSLGSKVFVGYLFHHESPRRSSKHLTKIVADLALRVKGGSNEVLELGDLSVEKEYTFAGDVVEGIFALVSQDKVFEAAIGSGVAHSVRDWLDTCFRAVDRDWRRHIRIREGFVPEYKRLISDPSTIRGLGWSPRVSLSELAEKFLVPEVHDSPRPIEGTTPTS